MRALAPALFLTAMLMPCVRAQNTTSTQQKEALLAQATHEMGAGRLDEGAKLTCQAAQLDPADKDLTERCKQEVQMVAKQLQKFAVYVSDGVSLASSGHFDQAEKAFQRVKFGPYKPLADEWLQTKLPQMRKEAKTLCKCQCESERWHFPE